MNPCVNPNPPGTPSALRLGRRTAAAAGGFTLIEVTVASALLSLFLASLFALNSTVLRMLRSASETVAASQELQTRIEQLRLVNWSQISQSGSAASANVASVRSVLSLRTDALDDLPGITERVEVGRYPDPLTYDGNGNVVLPAPAFSVERNEAGTLTVRNGAGQIITTNVNLVNEERLFVRVVVNWTSWGGRVRSRELLTVSSRWGISR